MVARSLYALAIVASFFGAVLCNEYNGIKDDKTAKITIQEEIIGAGIVDNILHRELPDVKADSIKCNDPSADLATPTLNLPIGVLREQAAFYSPEGKSALNYETHVYGCTIPNVDFTYFMPAEFGGEKNKTNAKGIDIGYNKEVHEENVEIFLVRYELFFGGDATADYFTQAYLKNGRQVAIIGISGEVTGIEPADVTAAHY